jgi:hypothetical protein
MPERLASEARPELESLAPLQRYLVDLWSVDRLMPLWKRFAMSANAIDLEGEMRDIIDEAWDLPRSTDEKARAAHLIQRLDSLLPRTDERYGEYGGTAQQIALQLGESIEAYLSGTPDAAEVSLVAALETQHMKGEEDELYGGEQSERPRLVIQRPGVIRPTTRAAMENEMRWRGKGMRAAAEFDGANIASIRFRESLP